MRSGPPTTTFAPLPLYPHSEVSKCAVTHYFKMDKARKQLGYEPVYNEEMVEKAAAWYKQRGYGPSNDHYAVMAFRLIKFLLAIALSVAVLVFLLQGGAEEVAGEGAARVAEKVVADSKEL